MSLFSLAEPTRTSPQCERSNYQENRADKILHRIGSVSRVLKVQCALSQRDSRYAFQQFVSGERRGRGA